MHTEGGDGRGLGFVSRIDNERAREVCVQFGHTERGRIVAELSEHFVGWAFEGFASDDGTDGEYFSFVGAEFIANLKHSENRTNTDQRIAGADQDAVGITNRLESAGSGTRGFHTCETNSLHDGFGAALDEIFLEMQRAFARIDDRGNGTV